MNVPESRKSRIFQFFSSLNFNRNNREVNVSSSPVDRFKKMCEDSEFKKTLSNFESVCIDIQELLLLHLKLNFKTIWELRIVSTSFYNLINYFWVQGRFSFLQNSCYISYFPYQSTFLHPENQRKINFAVNNDIDLQAVISVKDLLKKPEVFEGQSKGKINIKLVVQHGDELNQLATLSEDSEQKDFFERVVELELKSYMLFYKNRKALDAIIKVIESRQFLPNLGSISIEGAIKYSVNVCLLQWRDNLQKIVLSKIECRNLQLPKKLDNLIILELDILDLDLLILPQSLKNLQYLIIKYSNLGKFKNPAQLPNLIFFSLICVEGLYNLNFESICNRCNLLISLCKQYFKDDVLCLANLLYNISFIYNNFCFYRRKALEYRKQAYSIFLNLDVINIEKVRSLMESLDPFFSYFIRHNYNVFQDQCLGGNKIGPEYRLPIFSHCKEVDVELFFIQNKMREILFRIIDIVDRKGWTKVRIRYLNQDCGVKGYVERSYIKSELRIESERALDLAQMLCFEAMNLGIMGSEKESKPYEVAENFTREYPELVKKIAKEHPEFFVDGLIVEACVRAMPDRKSQEYILAHVLYMGMEERKSHGLIGALLKEVS